MKVTIDTKEDSHEDIRKVLHLLTSILERKGNSTDIKTNTERTDTTSMMNMFADTPQTVSQPVQQEKPDTPPNFSSFINLSNNKEPEEKKEDTKIEFF